MPALKEMVTSGLLKEAIAFSHKNAESKQRWDCVRELQRRGEPEIFETAKSWCGSDDVTKRELAADILAQLGPLTQEGREQLRPFTKQTISLLERLLDDPEARVIASSIHALGHHYVWEPIAENASLASHPSDAVRFAVASTLGGATSPHAIEILINLTQDKKGDVRDWATFGLGAQYNLDTLEIREALFQRLSDNHFDTNSEALVSLAIRHDERVVPFIKAALEADSVGMLAVEAAGTIASGELIIPLEGLIDWWDVDTELLNAALKRCRGEPCPDDDWRWDTVATHEA